MMEILGKRFVDKIQIIPNGCFVWIAAKNPSGYGIYHLRKIKGKTKTILAHRYSFKQFKGEIPLGLELDHLCKNRSCVNPEHLEPVTHKENLNRGLGGKRTHCLRGHSYLEVENIYIKPSDGKRDCRKCKVIRRKIFYDLHRY